MRTAKNMAWSGYSDTLIIWDNRYVPISTLKSGDEFKLFGWRWRVRRQAGRTTFADGIGDWEGCKIQLKHSREVEVPRIVRADDYQDTDPAKERSC